MAPRTKLPDARREDDDLEPPTLRSPTPIFDEDEAYDSDRPTPVYDMAYAPESSPPSVRPRVARRSLVNETEERRLR